MVLNTFHEFEDCPLYYLGPKLDGQALASVLYFSISGPESLTLSPYNQLTDYLDLNVCRVFSVTLPGHHEGQDKFKAMEYWADHLEELESFVAQMHRLLDFLFQSGHLESERFVVAGLSRGAWVATHLLSHPKVKKALGLAPLTDLSFLEEFQHIESQKLKRISLENILEHILRKQLRYYIGNRDERVGTSKAFEFVSEFANQAYDLRIRSSQAELLIGPSAGAMGHGTLPPTFQDAALWIQKQIVE